MSCDIGWYRANTPLTGAVLTPRISRLLAVSQYSKRTQKSFGLIENSMTLRTRQEERQRPFLLLLHIEDGCLVVDNSYFTVINDHSSKGIINYRDTDTASFSLIPLRMKS